MPIDDQSKALKVPGGTVKNADHWQHPLSGHGLAYFRELVVEYQTLQWVNPHAATAAAARREANEKAATLTRATEALKPAPFLRHPPKAHRHPPPTPI